RAPERIWGPLLRNANPDGLPTSVNTGVGATRTERGGLVATQSLERVLDDALDGALLGLSLPATESRAVIVQNELHGTLRH
ncbi:MAG: hypothetical protein WD825_13570, partial [Gemmatimonadaceae bacterium]